MQGLVGNTSCLHSPILTRIKNKNPNNKIIKCRYFVLNAWLRSRVRIGSVVGYSLTVESGSGSTPPYLDLSIALTFISREKILGRNLVGSGAGYDLYKGQIRVCFFCGQPDPCQLQPGPGPNLKETRQKL